MRKSISADDPGISYLATFSVPLRGEGHFKRPLWQNDQVRKLASRIFAHLRCARIFIVPFQTFHVWLPSLTPLRGKTLLTPLLIPDVSRLATFFNAALRQDTSKATSHSRHFTSGYLLYRRFAARHF
jgi:hypothetical protein